MARALQPLCSGGDPLDVTSMCSRVSHLETKFGVHYGVGGVAAVAKAMAAVGEDQGGAVLMGGGAANAAARAFLADLRGPRAGEVLARYGYSLGAIGE